MYNNSSFSIKNEIAKSIVKSMNDNSNVNIPAININQNIFGIKKEFWIGNFKISINIH